MPPCSHGTKDRLLVGRKVHVRVFFGRPVGSVAVQYQLAHPFTASRDIDQLATQTYGLRQQH